MEVLLRVRQSSNPTFTFLLPGDPLYPYYRWIVEANPKVRVMAHPRPKVQCGQFSGEVKWVPHGGHVVMPYLFAVRV